MSGGFGRLLGGLAGAFLGSFIGQPALGFSIGSALFGSLFAEDQNTTVEGPRIDDLSVQTSAYGKPIPIIYGAFRAAGNIIWMENNQIKETKNVQTQEQGGKGGPSRTQTQITYTYSASFALSIAEGPIDGVRRVWADSVLIADNSDTATLETIYNGAILDQPATGGNISSIGGAGEVGEFGRIIVYKGDKNQKPNPRIQADQPDTPAYRGTAYLLFEDLQLERFGNRLPQITVEVLVGGDGQCMRFFDLAKEFDSVGFSIKEGVITNIENITINPTSDNFGTLSYYDLITYDLQDGSQLYKERVPLTLLETNDSDPFIERLVGTSTIMHHVPDRSAYNRENSWIWEGSSGGVLGFVKEPADQDSGVYSGSPEQIQRNLANFPMVDGTYCDGFIYGVGAYDPPNEPSNSLFFGKWRSPDNPNRVTGAVLSSELLAYADKYTYQAEFGDTSLQNLVISESDGQVFIARQNVIVMPDMEDSGLAPIKSWSVPNLKGLRQFAIFGNILMGVDASRGGGNQDFLTLWRLNDNGTVTEVCQGTEEVSFGRGPIKVSSRLALVGNKLVGVGPFYGQDGILLADILDDLCGRANITPNTSAITETCRGYAVTKPMSVSSAIGALRPVFRFDGVEVDYTLEFKPRELSAIRTLTEQDIGVIESNSEPLILSQERTPDVFLPRRIRIRYIDQDRDYEQGTQYAGRIVTNSEEIKQIDAAVVMVANEAAKTADIVLKELWTRRQSYQFNISMDHVDLMPGDVVNLETDEVNTTVRIQSIDDGIPGIRKIEGVVDGAFIYSSNNEGETGGAIAPAVPRNPGPTQLALLDIPLLRDNDDGTGFYIAAGNVLSGWGGANVFETDFTNSFDQIVAFFDPALIGSVQTQLIEDPLTTTWDESQDIIVGIPQGSLESKTEEEVLNGANLAAIKAVGGWELIQFVNVTDNGDGTFTISKILRGRLGTEWATDRHSDGDKFVLIKSDGSTRRHPKNIAAIGEKFGYKAVSFGLGFSDAPLRTLDFESVGQKPWSPVHIEGTRDGSDNLDITWVRRARYGGEWRNGFDIPNTEATEEYEIDILDGNGNVVRTLTSTATSVTYTATDQTTDFGSTQASIDVKIYQISDVVGRGYAGEATL